MICRTLARVSMLAVLAACSSGITLTQKGPVPPPGTELSGQWRLVSTETARSRKVDQALVKVFLENGDALKITQTLHGLFISFDRAVVEEYRFGEMREVNVGPVIAMRASGWDGAGYVIQTLDDDGFTLTERYRLQEGGDVLLRRVVMERRNSTFLDVRQRFDRRPEPGAGGTN